LQQNENGAPVPDATPYDVYETPDAYLSHRHINAGLLFLFSFLLPPGANYMYMGLIKRGLAVMCGFFLIVHLTASANSLTLLFALCIPILWLTSLFDGFHTRGRINRGEHVQDDVGDILGGLFKNKAVALVAIIIIGIALAGSLIGVAAELIRRAVPLILIIFAGYLIFRQTK